MKFAIFDFDGTLFDSAGVWKDLDLEYLSKYNIVPEDDVRKKIISMSLYDSAVYLKNIYNLSVNVDDAIVSLYQIIGQRYENNIMPKNGVKSFLDSMMQKDIRMCIATLSSRNHVIRALKNFDMVKYFEFVIGSEDINTSKTSPEIFYMALKQLNATANETCVFEDSIFALQTAKKEGFITAGVYDEYSKGDSKRIKEISDYYIENYQETDIFRT